MKIRCENTFDINLYNSIKNILIKLVEKWKVEKVISIKEMIIITELVEHLTRNSNFLIEKEQILVEDASLEIREILNNLNLEEEKYEKVNNNFKCKFCNFI